MTHQTDNTKSHLEDILGVKQLPLHTNIHEKRTTSPSGKHFPKKFTVPVVSDDYMA
jgi:hypothetical protein